MLTLAVIVAAGGARRIPLSRNVTVICGCELGHTTAHRAGVLVVDRLTSTDDGENGVRLRQAPTREESMVTSRRQTQGLDEHTHVHQGTGTPAKPTEPLAFTVGIVRDEATLQQTVASREAAYRRHLPAFAAGLATPEADDTAPDCTLWCARSKADGAVLGSMRVQTNALRPLSMERSVRLPLHLQGARLSDARRLAVVAGPKGAGVRHAIFKANLLRLQAHSIEWSVVGARPSRARIYLGLLFTDMLDGATFIPEPVARNVPHQLLAFDMADAEARFARAVPSWHRYVYGTHHPDIRID